MYGMALRAPCYVEFIVTDFPLRTPDPQRRAWQDLRDDLVELHFLISDASTTSPGRYVTVAFRSSAAVQSRPVGGRQGVEKRLQRFFS